MKIVIKSRKKLIRIGMIVLVILSLLGAAGYTLFIQKTLEQDTYLYKETKVTYGDLQVGIMESGSIETEEETQKYELDLVEDSEGDTESEDDDVDISEYLKFEEVYVAVGQRVKKGDPIYKLKDSTVENVRKKLALEEAEAETALAEANLSCSLDTLEAEHTSSSDSFSGAKAEGIYHIETAQLNNEVAGYVAAIKECYANIDIYNKQIADTKTDDDGEAYEDYLEAKKDYDEADKENERTFVTIQSDYISAKEKYDSMMETIEDYEDKIADEVEDIQDYLAKIQDAQTTSGADVLTAKQEYETDTLAGSISQDTYKYSVGSAEEEVTEAQSDLDDAKEKMEDFESFVGDGTIYAESDGLITAVNYEVGDALSSTSDLISYVTESSITLSVDVSEEDIVDIAVGDSVNIEFTAYPDENYQGEVTAITTTATSDHATTVSYPVTIKVIGDTSKLFAGMTGDVTFVTDEKSEVLYVSRKAIVEQNGKSYVYQKDKNGDMILTKVTAGFTDGVNVEITEGLTKDDVIYIASKVTSESEDSAES